MTSYARVAVTGSIVEGPQQQHQQSPKGDRFNGAFGVRRAWWWQAGPVDSYCFCFSLGTGVALTAMGSLLSGIGLLFFHRVYEAYIIDSLEMLREQYARSCEGSAASTTVVCMQLKATVEQAEGPLNFPYYPMVAYVQAVLNIVSGVFGLWTVFFKHIRAAKVYMLTRAAARTLVVVWGALEMRSLCAKYGMEQGPIIVIVVFLTFLRSLYNLKVAWSYCQRMLEYSYDALPSRRGAASDTGYHATPMLAMNTTV